MKFRISDDLVLGGELVVSTAGIFATKGMGKSYLAQVMAEEMLEHGQVIVVIDPTDVWSGLRSSADGKSDGYPILVIGGDHGDLKLDPELGAGTRLAEAIVAERFSCVICTDGIDDTLAIRYVREVLSTIYRKNRKPLHVFVDEADIFAPQVPKEEEDHRCIRAVSHIVRRGRKKGIGSTLITQRPSELNASARSQVEMLFVLGMLHHLDIDAVEKWLRLRKKKRGSSAAFELQEEMIESIDTLQCGDAWVWAPRLTIHKRFRARAKRTFDSGATPKPGQKTHKAKKLAAVDIVRLGAVIAEAAQRQKESDPRALRAKIAELVKERDQLSRAVNAMPTKSPASSARVVEKTKVVEKPVLRDGQIARVEKLLERAEKVGAAANARIEKTIEDVRATFGAASARVEQGIDELRAAVKLANAPSPVASTRSNVARLDKNTILWTPGRKATSEAVAKVKARARPSDGPNGPSGPNGSDGAGDLKPAHLRILSAIAWWEGIGVSEPDFVGVAFVAKTSVKSSSFENNRSRLRAGGYIDYPTAGRMRLTEAGRSLAPPPQIPATTDALQAAVLSQVTPAIGRMLRVLIESYPDEVSFEDLAERAGTSVKSSSFENNRSWIKARGLSTYPRAGFVRATEILFPETS